MSVKDTEKMFDQIPGETPPGISYPLTDLELRCPRDDAAKPIGQRQYKLAIRCVGVLDGATKPLEGEQLARTLDMTELRNLPRAARDIIVAFVNLCEKGVKLPNQTHVEDFDIPDPELPDPELPDPE